MLGAPRNLRVILTGVLGMSLAVACSAGEADQDNARTFSFTYEAEVPAQPAGTGPIDVFIPLAVSDAHQAILRRDVKARIPRRETIESRYGNKFWHGHVDRSDGKPITCVVGNITKCPAWGGSPSMRPKHGSTRSAAISISARSLRIASSSPSGGIWNWETATPPVR